MISATPEIEEKEGNLDLGSQASDLPVCVLASVQVPSYDVMRNFINKDPRLLDLKVNSRSNALAAPSYQKQLLYRPNTTSLSEQYGRIYQQ